MGWPEIHTGPERRRLSARLIRLHLTGTFPLSKGHPSLLCGASAREEAGLAFSTQPALPASGRLSAMRDTRYKISSQCLSPPRRLHGGGCQRKAKQIRGRNDAPVFPRCARSMEQIGSFVCECVCLHEGTARKPWCPTATPAGRK